MFKPSDLRPPSCPSCGQLGEMFSVVDCWRRMSLHYFYPTPPWLGEVNGTRGLQEHLDPISVHFPLRIFKLQYVYTYAFKIKKNLSSIIFICIFFFHDMHTGSFQSPPITNASRRRCMNFSRLRGSSQDGSSQNRL